MNDVKDIVSLLAILVIMLLVVFIFMAMIYILTPAQWGYGF